VRDPEPFGEFVNEDPHFKVGLVHPYLPEAANKNRLKYRESLALGYLTASLEAHGFPVVSVNAEMHDLSPADVVGMLLAEPAIRLIGISAKSQRTYAAAQQIAKLVKAVRPDIHISLGGVFPSAADEEIITACPAIDSVVRGEGEYAIVELAARLSLRLPLDEMRGLTFRSDGRPKVTPERLRIQDLDALPFPARRDLQHIIDQGRRAPSAYIVASRGCYAKCTFCSIHQIYGDHLVMRRTPGSIIAEMSDVIDRYGTNRFSFVDDLFIMPSRAGVRWVHEFCDTIAERNLKVRFYAEIRADTVERSLIERLTEAGLERLFLGIEAGVDSVLTRFDKGTTVAENVKAVRELKTCLADNPESIEFGYIMYDPEMTFEELKGMYVFLRESGVCKPQHLQNKMNIYWGTPQYKRMMAQGRVDDSDLGERWNYEFDDPRVGGFERAMRRFLVRYEAEQLNPIADARERCKERLYKRQDRPPLAPWLADLLVQALRRLEAAERRAWYFMFDSYLAWLDQGRELTRQQEDEVWQALGPLFARIAAESRSLVIFADTIEDLVERTAREASAPGSAREVRSAAGSRAVARLMGDGDTGYVAEVNAHGWDRYDHVCSWVRFRPDGAYQVVEEVELEPLYGAAVLPPSPFEIVPETDVRLASAS
jgi:radical SAM superfamily enzyme YgiQ (UPF0313 family)